MSSDLRTIMGLRDGDMSIDDINKEHNPLKKVLTEYRSDLYDRLLSYLSGKQITDVIKFTNLIHFIYNHTQELFAMIDAMEEIRESRPWEQYLDKIENDKLKGALSRMCYRLEEDTKSKYAYTGIMFFELWEAFLDASINDYWDTRISSMFARSRFGSSTVEVVPFSGSSNMFGGNTP